MVKLIKFILKIFVTVLNVLFLLFQIPFAVLFLFLGFVFLIVSIIIGVFMLTYIAKTFFDIAIALDVTANAALSGKRGKTISGRLGARITEGRATKAEIYLCMLLSFLDLTSKSHCRDAHAYEVNTLIKDIAGDENV